MENRIAGYSRWRIPGGAALAVGLMLFGTATPAATPSFAGVWEQVRKPQSGDPARREGSSPTAAETEEIFFAPLLPPFGDPVLKPPYSKTYEDFRKRLLAAEAGGTPLADPHSRCLPEGMPQMMLAVLPIEIVEIPGKIVILGELFGELRHIYLNEKMPPLDELTPTFAGNSVAHWEGSTLVVETRGVREDVELFHIPHSADMKIIERIRLTARGTLEDSIVISDPTVLAKPYKVKFEYQRADDYKIAEYICDNNRYEPKNGLEVLDTSPAR